MLHTIWVFFSNPNVLTAVGGGITSVGTGVFAFLSSRKKSNVTISLTSSFDAVTKILQRDNNELRLEILELRREIQYLRNQRKS